MIKKKKILDYLLYQAVVLLYIHKRAANYTFLTGWSHLSMDSWQLMFLAIYIFYMYSWWISFSVYLQNFNL